jgi:Domain of unknown function (DUF4279)
VRNLPGWYFTKPLNRWWHPLPTPQTRRVRTTASFRVQGDGPSLTVDAVSRKLGLQPTQSSEAGDRVSPRSSARRADSMWIINSSSGVEDGVELSEQLERLLQVLEPVTTPLWDLCNSGYKANWYCWVESHATEHAVVIDRNLME